MSDSKRQKKSYIYFYSGSGQPWCQLSNFSRCEISLDRSDPEAAILEQIKPELKEWLPAKFLSIEHLWKSLQSKDVATFQAFQVGGRFGDLTLESIEPIYRDKAKEKLQYWSRNHNVGIIAKLISNPTRYKKLGLNLDIHLERLPSETERQVWEALLYLKYRQNPNHCEILKSTGNLILVEYDQRASENTHWGGRYIDGELIGENVMGNYLEATRAKFL